MQQTVSTGLSMPKPLKDWIDRERGDIPRSKFITRMLEEIQIHRNTRFGIEDSQSESWLPPGAHSETNDRPVNKIDGGYAD
jgi:hypothetical protein